MTELVTQMDLLSQDEVDHFWTQGYVRVPAVYAPEEVDELAEDLDVLIDRWAGSKPWTGPWREVLLDPDMAAKIELRGLHDLGYYSAAWARATSNAKLAGVLRCLLGPAVELHHTTMHVKPPERGQPFPLHQDWPFYPHTDDRYVDVLLHLDDTSHENGEILLPSGFASRRSAAARDGRQRDHVPPTSAYRPVPARGYDAGAGTARGHRLLQHQHHPRLVPQHHLRAATAGADGVPAPRQRPARRPGDGAAGGHGRRHQAPRARSRAVLAGRLTLQAVGEAPKTGLQLH